MVTFLASLSFELNHIASRLWAFFVAGTRSMLVVLRFQAAQLVHPLIPTRMSLALAGPSNSFEFGIVPALWLAPPEGRSKHNLLYMLAVSPSTTYLT
ncbi:MAG: hypothetical protein LC802_10075 [Acidobacteria bacterium]|nr:hypothetical protein [Acidobacteriota bacterium]